MAKQTTAQLKALIQDLDENVGLQLPDNVTQEISAPDLKDLIYGLTTIMENICDSLTPLP